VTVKTLRQVLAIIEVQRRHDSAHIAWRYR